MELERYFSECPFIHDNMRRLACLHDSYVKLVKDVYSNYMAYKDGMDRLKRAMELNERDLSVTPVNQYCSGGSCGGKHSDLDKGCRGCPNRLHKNLANAVEV